MNLVSGSRAALTRYWPLVALLTATLLLEGVHQLVSDDAGVAVTDVPVSSVRLVCPSSTTTTAAGTLAMAAVPIGSEQTASEVVATVIAADDENADAVLLPDLPATLTGQGGTAAAAMPAGAAPVMVEGSGILAATTSAVVTSAATSGDDRGLATATCSGPATSWWFMGGQSTLGRLTRIVITNPDLAPATFDISIFGDRGPIDAPAGRGLSVPAMSRLEVRLDALAPNSQATAIHVKTVSGRVHAAVLLRAVNGLTALGSEWLPATTPATRIVIPIPAGLSDIQAMFMARRETPTQFTVVVRTPEGVFTPSGAEGLAPNADSVVSLPMDDALGDGGVLEITSDVGVVASVIARVRTSGLSDFIAFGSSPSIKGVALATGLRPDSQVTLSLAAWDAIGEVELITISTDGTQASSRIAVSDAGMTQTQVALNVGALTTVLIKSPLAISASVTSQVQGTQGIVATTQTLNARPTSVSAPTARLVVGIEQRASDTK